MTKNEDFLERFQEDLQARLESDTWFDDIPVLLQRRGLTDADINEKIGVFNTKAGKHGLVAIVLMPALEVIDGENRPGPQVEARAAIQILENRLINQESQTGTGKSAESTALHVLRLLHHFQPGAVDGRFYVANGRALEPMDPGLKNVVGYHVWIRSSSGLLSPERVARPAIAPAGGALPVSVSITTGTAGAAIYYTTDGSFPWSGNSQASLYSAPFNLAVSARVRAAAYLAGLVGSDVASQEF